MLYSEELELYAGDLSKDLQVAVEQTHKYFGNSVSEIFVYDEYNIAVKGNYKVSLPARGAVAGLIKETEPVIMVFNIKRYPYVAPRIYSDRLDFPKQVLSHLYVAKKGKPSGLCLVRGNPSEWFANIKLKDFLDIGAQWFYKAGTGFLDEDGGEFDPTRLDGYSGNHIYDYDLVFDTVSKNNRLVPDLPMALFISGQLVENAKVVDYKSVHPVPFLALNGFRKQIKEWYSQNAKGVAGGNSPMFSVVFWHPEQLMEPGYLTHLPQNYGELKTFFNDRGIALKETLEQLENEGLIFKRGVPIIYAAKRPSKLIGYDGEYEFFNFVILVNEKGIKHISKGEKVWVNQHLQPFTSKMAREIGGNSLPKSILYLGAGSLGSKMIMHGARGGNKHFGVVDDDKFLSHNLARHVLFADDIGRNKAEALVEKIKGFYQAETTDKIKAEDRNIVFDESLDFASYELLVETTASTLVRNKLIDIGLPKGIKYVRVEIADDGHLGLLSVEGPNRNPRMDDLNYYACFLGAENERIKSWRTSDIERGEKNLNIGQGCSSTTTVMSDDLISFHASVFARAISNSTTLDQQTGSVEFSFFDEENGNIELSNQKIHLEPLEILQCNEGSGWEVRITSIASAKMLSYADEKSPKETGGVLVGIANYKLRTIHVYDVIPAPPDSVGTEVRFQRGIIGLPEAIDRIKFDTGNIIGYIGEWHSHPMNLEKLSGKDRSTIAQLREINSRVPIPTCAIIVTKGKILPFVFE